MGLKNRSQSTYVKVKDGKFYLSTDKENKTPYDELEGMITDLYLRTDEWEGQEIEKLCIVMNDGEDDYTISFSFDSAYTSSLVGFLKNVNLQQPLTLVPVEKVEGDKKRRSILVKQNGKWAKQYYTREGGEVPEMKEVVVNKKKIWDKTEFLDFFRNVIEKELKPVAQGNAETKVAATAGVTSGATMSSSDITEHVNQADDDDVQDDLPF